MMDSAISFFLPTPTFSPRLEPTMSSSDGPSSDLPEGAENDAIVQSVTQKLTHSLLTKATKKRK